MTDRTVAEVMGWQRPTGFFSTGPTPDDMLSWLSERVRDGEWNTEGDIGVVYQRDDLDSYVEVQWYCEAGSEIVSASTLHAALEAAVLAVSAAQEDET